MLTVAGAISHKVNNAYLRYISMQVSPQRLQCWRDAGRSVVKPAHVISFCHPSEWHAGRVDVNWSLWYERWPQTGEDGSAVIRIENADGSSRSQGSSIMPCSQMKSLQTAVHKDCKSANSASVLQKTLWEFITELFQHTSFNSVLFFNINSPWG